MDDYYTPADAKINSYEGEVPEWLYKEQAMFRSVIEATKTICDATNCMGRNMHDIESVMLNYIGRDHRTIQQNVMTILIQLVVDYSKQNYDLRNQHSVDTCKVIADTLEQKGLTYNGKYMAPVV